MYMRACHIHSVSYSDFQSIHFTSNSNNTFVGPGADSSVQVVSPQVTNLSTRQ